MEQIMKQAPGFSAGEETAHFLLGFLGGNRMVPLAQKAGFDFLLIHAGSPLLPRYVHPSGPTAFPSTPGRMDPTGCVRKRNWSPVN